MNLYTFFDLNIRGIPIEIFKNRKMYFDYKFVPILVHSIRSMIGISLIGPATGGGNREWIKLCLLFRFFL